LLQIDQNQCLHLKGYYGFDQPKRGGANGLSRASRPSVIITLPGNERFWYPLQSNSTIKWGCICQLI
jgi:hypothetical protein